MVQWLRLRASVAGGAGLIPGQGTKILHAVWSGQKRKKQKPRLPGYDFLTPVKSVCEKDLFPGGPWDCFWVFFVFFFCGHAKWLAGLGLEPTCRVFLPTYWEYHFK